MSGAKTADAPSFPALVRQFFVESAYYVARDRGVEAVEALHRRGVRVRVLTNSLASNDVLAAHAGYSERRNALVENGVELYELRPDAGSVKQRILSHRSKAALQTKAIVFDGKDVFIGSFNLDPRSGDINTEAGLSVESAELAERVIAYVDEGVLPQNSYRVLLDEDDDLVWVTEDNGREVRYEKDPGSTGSDPCRASSASCPSRASSNPVGRMHTPFEVSVRRSGAEEWARSEYSPVAFPYSASCRCSGACEV